MSAPSDAAAADAAAAPAHTTSAASPSGGFTFKLHPLVIMNVSDHHTRVKAQAASSGAGAGQPPRVFGCVIGVQRGRTVEIFNSFELVLDPVSGTLDHALLDKEQELYKAAFPDLYVLGWYSTGSDVHDTDMQIHKALMDINESVVYLLLNPTINLNLSRKDLPVTIYKSELGVIGGNPQLIFVKSDYTIAEDQAIYDKICHSVVEIVCYESVAPHDLICSIPGVITKLGDGYCHIIAYNKESLFSSGQFELIFPDKEKMKMKISEEVLGQVGQRPPKLLPLCVSVNRSPQMKSVDFSKQDVSMNDEVFAVGFDINLPSYHLSPGNVTHEREEYFSYDSPAHSCTSWGDLVFNKQAELVGISCEDRGVTNALNVKSITKCLSSCYEGCYEGMTLDEILQSIHDQAKEMFGSRD